MIKLYDYQTQYLENMPKNIVMTADVGLGKTIMALEHFRRWSVYRDGRGEYTRHVSFNTKADDVWIIPRTKLVVVAPASKVRTGDWQREIENYFGKLGDGSNGISYDVVSYEMFVKRMKLSDYINSDTTIIIDESHMACNATTLRGKAVIKATRLAKQWIMLSATPLPNGWRSAESYAVLTGLSKNKTDFVQRFVIIDRSRGFPLIMGYREKEVLEAWWAKISKPLERTGDMKLPSENFGVTPEMDKKTAFTYERALKQRLIRVGDEDEMLDNPSKLFVTLRQIPNKVRIDALQSIVESTTEHIVVFYNFNSEREAMLEMLNKSFKGRKLYEQSGHKSHLPPRANWGRIKPSVTLVQYQSGSQAIELTYASVTVYLSPCTSYANYEQSKGRTRRNGQEKTTLFYHIAAEGSLDRHIWGLLKKKQDFSTALFQKLLDIT